MTPKIFITGVTGYIGGDALYALYKAHPEYEYTAIVRSSDKGALVAAEYPKIHLVYGTLEDVDLLEAEASKADVVVHTADASDNAGAAHAIVRGKPNYYIHTSGTGILCWKDMQTGTYGEPPSSSYNDLEPEALTNLPDEAFHRNVDKIVLASGLKEAIVCPPTIYGAGRGPGNKRSRQIYNLTEVTLKNGRAPMLGRGLTEWDNVHVHDLSELYVLLVEAAVAKNESTELWGQQGYFFAENGHHVWGAVSKQIGEAAMKAGYTSTAEVEPMTTEKAKEVGGFEALSWGLNSKGHAGRAGKHLGWKPHAPSLQQEIPSIVESEAKLLGLSIGHAKKVSGV